MEIYVRTNVPCMQVLGTFEPRATGPLPRKLAPATLWTGTPIESEDLGSYGKIIECEQTALIGAIEASLHVTACLRSS
jgi:hypothetical protein